MGTLLDILKAANSLSPIAVMGLLSGIVWMLVRSKDSLTKEVQVIGSNHLHELPELVENSRQTVETLQRIEVKLGENFAVLMERTHGKP